MSQYISPLPSNAVVITDDTAHTVLVPPPGMSKGHIDRDYAADPVGANFATPPDDFLIDESLWDDLIEEGERNKSNLMHLWLAAGAQPLNQNGTNYCWCFAVISAMIALLIRSGRGYVPLSPAFAACQIKGFRNQGGWDMEAVKFISKNGTCEQRLWPQASRDRKYLTDEARENAKNYIIEEWWDVPDGQRFEYKVSSLLRNLPMPSGYSWWGHETCGMAVVKLKNDGPPRSKYGFIDINSWGAYGPKNDGFFVLSASKGTPGNCSIPKILTPT